ncbi:MAG: cysteine hydrolase family protein [Pseudomonadota bacterium]
MRKPIRPFGSHAVHVVVDMQRLFAEDTAWGSPNTRSVVTPILRLLRFRPEPVIFTRFLTPRRLEDMPGSWQNYYRHWPTVLLERMDPAMLDLMPEFRPFVPPAEISDKRTFSSFADGDFAERLRQRRADTLILTGVETDMCVLGTAFDAVDRGYRVVIATDAVASSMPAAHQAMLDHIYPRLEFQLDLATVEEIMAAWSVDANDPGSGAR